MSVWLLCALLSSLICTTEQDGHPLSIKEVNVYAETDTHDNGAWVLNVEWRDGFAENNESMEVSYEVQVYHTEKMNPVHNETVHVTPNNTTHHHWKWTSPIPLQCTSHSVRLRRRDQDHTGEWTPLYTYKGQDLIATRLIVYPRDHVFMVGSTITFCCIFKTAPSPDSKFQICISNRTYITKPVHFLSPSEATSDILCNDKGGNSAGSSVFIGYPPDDQNLTCMTRDLNSVECHWNRGRKTYLDGTKKTIYTLNGRDCDFDKCVLPAVPKQVTIWTLIGKNPLGVKTLTDTADPTHRVWLRAPSKVSYAAYARNVTLLWSWNVKNYILFPMICQAMLNGSIYNKTFNGLGLSSIVIVHLQPFANYTVKVRCGSDEHFYKWGDWSEITEFSTKEDIPEAVDVWIQYFEQNTYVLWKPLTQQQSHGTITQYKLTKGKRREIIDITPETKLCYNISPGNERTDQKITVSAKNSAGLSPPSMIIVPGYPDNEVNVSQIYNGNAGFEIAWDGYFNSTCGYVVEWFPTYYETQCAVEWKKIPECDHPAFCTWKQYGIFEAGVKYTVSVYACIDDKPMLLRRSEGYAIEQRPSGTVQNLRGKQNGINLELSWDEVPLQQQKGFIKSYRVITYRYDSKTPVITSETDGPEISLTLDPGSYTFNVSAITSGGLGDPATFRMNIEKDIEQMIVATVVGFSSATLVFIIITILCYRKRKWLKKLLYPDIPEPKLAGEWNSKGFKCTQMTEGYMKCEIHEVHNSERPATTESLHGLDLIRSNSTVFPAQHSNQNVSKSPVLYLPLWPCARKLTSIVENPSYNMSILEPVDVAQISELTLEMEDSYLPVPNCVQKNVVVKDSSGYKPQST
ncbi:LIF receptor subunit alpha b [Rhinichthys klamathensis goyatoka]|uniref:LIF receptor subunit alpha b n=1 Tax=Rhinichthys klamathensis goyatoka TaxID=3034132 RepID=UPI0024B4FCFD|nr:LIF receptor subunit alpha b [Rhinichthys klamathensis goyatoka]